MSIKVICGDSVFAIMTGHPPEAPFWFAHLSDPHLPQGADGLRKAIKEINAKTPAPEFIVITGDLITAKAFHELEQILHESSLQIYMLRGNHDADIDPTGEAFHDRLGFHRYYSFNVRGWHFIALDSSQPDTHEGVLDDAQIAWLSADLREWGSAMPTFIFIHHPILEDPILPRKTIPGLYLQELDASKLLEMIAMQPNVKGIFAGHVHRNSVSSKNGVTQVTVASVSKTYPDHQRVQYFKDTYGTQYVWYRYLTWLNALAPPPVYGLVYLDAGRWSMNWQYLTIENSNGYPM